MNSPTKHLPEYKFLDEALQLYGDKYTILKKAKWYSLHGISLMSNTIKVGAIRADPRMNLFIPLKSGFGKNNLKRVSKDILKKLKLRVEEPTSLHPEQLVGKVVKTKVRVKNEETGKWKTEEIFAPNKGYFDSDLIQFDEAADLLTSSEPLIEEIRKYICLATDPYGKNTISKRLVDNKTEERLEYDPQCTLLLFFQPVHVPASIITKGFMRRFLIPYVEFNNVNREEEFAKRLSDNTDTISSINVFATHLQKLRREYDFSFTPDAVESLRISHLALIDMGEEHSIKGAQYTSIVAFTLQDMLVRMSAILASSHGVSTITPEFVKLAFLDLAEFYQCQLNFILNKVDGSFDYGETWHGAQATDKECLEWLWNNNGRTEESSLVSIANFEKEIMQICCVKEDGARKRLKKFRQRGWVESKQVGQYDTKVWLAFKPMFEDSEGDKGDNSAISPLFLENIKQEYESLLKTIQPLPPSNKPDEKNQPLTLQVPSLQPLTNHTIEKTKLITTKPIPIEELTKNLNAEEKEQFQQIITHKIKIGEWYEPKSGFIALLK